MMRSLRTRLLLAVAALALAAVAAVAIAARQGTRKEFRQFEDLIRNSGGITARQVARDLDGRCCDRATLDAVAARLPPTMAVILTRADDGTLVASAGRPLESLSKLTTSHDGQALTISAARERGNRREEVGLKLLQEGAPLRQRDGREVLLYLVRVPDTHQEHQAAAFLMSIDLRLLYATGCVAVVVLTITWFLAQGIVTPLRDLQAAAHDIALGRFARRVEPKGGLEVVALGNTFNAMAAELERQQALRQTLLHDVAHELRTPLTALRCRLETVLDGLATDPKKALHDLQDEVLHLGRLVTDLQDVALAEARELRLEIEDVQLDGIVGSAVRAAGLSADARLRLDLSPDVIARADAVRVRQVILNLLTNADRHTPPDGSIVVKTAAGQNDVTVEVRNTGSELARDQIGRIFDRFYRTDPSRQRVTGGTGLGLAIVKHLVEAQGGRVWASSEHASVLVAFSLPRAR